MRRGACLVPEGGAVCQPLSMSGVWAGLRTGANPMPEKGRLRLPHYRPLTD